MIFKNLLIQFQQGAMKYEGKGLFILRHSLAQSKKLQHSNLRHLPWRSAVRTLDKILLGRLVVGVVTQEVFPREGLQT